MVIAMDSNITKELKLEWYARDIVRQIQESRKEANYNVDDRINISITSENTEVNDLVKNYATYIETETLSKLDLNIKNWDIEKEVDLEDFVVKIILKK
jgi:isoleucyl-tRNA synthetase